MSLLDRLALELTRKRRQWISGRRLSEIGGYGGWRSRISDLRTERGWQIACEVRSVKRRDGSYASVSFYKLEKGH